MNKENQKQRNWKVSSSCRPSIRAWHNWMFSLSAISHKSSSELPKCDSNRSIRLKIQRFNSSQSCYKTNLLLPLANKKMTVQTLEIVWSEVGRDLQMFWFLWYLTNVWPEDAKSSTLMLSEGIWASGIESLFWCNMFKTRFLKLNE